MNTSDLILDILNGTKDGRVERYANSYVAIADGDRLDVTKTIRILLKSKQITPDQITESGS